MTVRWVVGVDGSDHAERALRWCVSQAPNRVNVITLVRAWRDVITSASEMGVQALVEAQPEMAYASIDDLGQELDALGIAVESTVEYGGASEVLLDASSDADLLAVGARGLGGFTSLLLGSVGYQCATHARVPVIVVPAIARLDGRLDNVVVGMDGSRNAKAALTWALEFAPDATIRVVGAWRAPPMITRAEEDRFPELEELAMGLFNSAIDDVVGMDRNHRTIDRDFRWAHPVDALFEAGTTADLIVVGERGRSGLAATILGSVTTRMLHDAPCPVAVIPDATMAILT